MGLYPTSQSAASQVLDFYTMDFSMENAVANTKLCPRYSEAVKKVKDSKAYQDYEDQMVPLANRFSKLFNVPVNKLGDWYGYLDEFYARQCHGIAWPSGNIELLAV